MTAQCVTYLSVNCLSDLCSFLHQNGRQLLNSEETLDIPYVNFPDILRKWAEKNPNKTAYIFIDAENDRYELSFGELYDKATKFAKALIGHDVRKGDVIALNGRNLPEWLIACFGIQLAGRIPLCLLMLFILFVKNKIYQIGHYHDQDSWSGAASIQYFIILQSYTSVKFI